MGLFIKTGRVLRRAFSLVEVVLTLGIFGVLLTGFAVIMSSTLSSSSDVIKTDRAIDTLGALNEWLAQRDFASVYQWTQAGSNLYLYSFRASAALPTAEGKDYQAAVPTDENVNGLDFVLHTALRPEGDAKLGAELAAIDGPLYRVNLHAMSNNPGGATLPADLSTYAGGYLVVEADVYEVPSRSVQPDAMARPVIAFPVVVNRK